MYEGRALLQKLSFSLLKGEIATLIGASGSGKTTLLKLITGILKPECGTISVADQPLPTVQSHVAYMMQEDMLLPWRNVLQNMTITAELGRRRASLKSLYEEARQLCQEVELTGCEEMYPNELSGGMRQRVALARALLLKRPLLLLDEPFGSLDVSLREQMYLLLRRIQQKYGTTILMVTHDFRDALSLSDRILLLSNQTISKEWTIHPSMRHDPHAEGVLLREMRQALCD